MLFPPSLLLSKTNDSDLIDKMKAASEMTFPEQVRAVHLNPEIDEDWEEKLNEIIFRSDLEILKSLFVISMDNIDSHGAILGRITLTQPRTS